MIRGRYAHCVFCRIIAGEAPAEQVYQDTLTVAIVPIDPVTPGHVIVMPRTHVADFSESWLATSDTMHAAFKIARGLGGDCNLITSKGEAATQTIGHLHIHIVPRAPGDGLRLPWSP